MDDRARVHAVTEANRTIANGRIGVQRPAAMDLQNARPSQFRHSR